MNMPPPSNFGDTSEKKQVTFYDDESRPILTVVSSSEYTIHHPDGSETEAKDSQFIQTVTGQTIHPSRQPAITPTSTLPSSALDAAHIAQL